MGVPARTVQRQMNLAPLQQARMAQQSKTSWTVLFLKGYALLSRTCRNCGAPMSNYPGRSSTSIRSASPRVAHEREHEGERIVLAEHDQGSRAPADPEIEAIPCCARSKPIHEIKEFRRALKFAQRARCRSDWLLMWLGLNLGRQRAAALRHIPAVGRIRVWEQNR